MFAFYLFGKFGSSKSNQLTKKVLQKFYSKYCVNIYALFTSSEDTLIVRLTEEGSVLNVIYLSEFSLSRYHRKTQRKPNVEGGLWALSKDVPRSKAASSKCVHWTPRPHIFSTPRFRFVMNVWHLLVNTSVKWGKPAKRQGVRGKPAAGSTHSHCCVTHASISSTCTRDCSWRGRGLTPGWSRALQDDHFW